MGLKKTSLFVFRILIVIVAYWFLVRKILAFNDWDTILNHVISTPLNIVKYLIPLIVLAIINWVLRSVIWKYLSGAIQHLSLYEAFRSVFIGITSGSFTPARIGDYVGRASVFTKNDRKKGVFLAFLGNTLQSISVAIPGLISLYFYTRNYSLGNELLTQLSGWLAIASSAILIIITLTIPSLAVLIGSKIHHSKVQGVCNIVLLLGKTRYFKIISLNFLKNMFLYLELYILLTYWDIPVAINELLIVIPTYFFSLTFIPGFIFADLGLVGSYAMLILGTAFNQNPVVMFAAMALWILNVGVPILLGGGFLLTKEKKTKR